MKPSLRFLALAVFGWAGVRIWNLGALPGAELFQARRSDKAPAARSLCFWKAECTSSPTMAFSLDGYLLGRGRP